MIEERNLDFQDQKISEPMNKETKEHLQGVKDPTTREIANLTSNKIQKLTLNAVERKQEGNN